MRKKLNYIWSLPMLLVMGVLLLGSPAKAATLPIDEGFTPTAFADYDFTPTSDGTLTLTISGGDGGLMYFWLPSALLTTDGQDVDPSYSNGSADTFTPASIIKWDLTGGKTYVFNLPVDKTPAEIGTYTFTYSGSTGGGGNTEPDTPGTGDGQIELGVPFTTPSVNFGDPVPDYTFIPDFTGQLLVKTNQWSMFGYVGQGCYFLFQSPNEQNAMTVVDMIGEDDQDGWWYVFDVTAGKTYYLHWDSAATFTFLKYGEGEGGGGSTEPDTPVEIPQGYAAMEFDKSYTPAGVGSMMVYFTPESNGTLKVFQAGTYDSHLFSAAPVYSDEYGYENNYGIMMHADYTPVTGGYEIEYGLLAGKTYFAVAKLSNGDGLTSTSFQWLPDGETGNSIELNQETSIATNAVYTFKAPESGILTINTNQYSTGIANIDGSQYVIYSNAACSAPLPALKNDDGTILNGWMIQVQVTEGTVYYLTNPTLDPLTVLLTLSEGEATGAITKIEPTPGTAYNAVDFGNQWNIITSPSNTSVQSIEFKYIDKEGQGQTETVNAEFAGGAFRIDANNLVDPATHKVYDKFANDTDVTYVFHGLKAGDAYVSEYEGEGQNYVVIGENGEVSISFMVGSPITLVSKTVPEPFYQKFEAGNANAVATFTYSGEVVSVDEVTVIQGRVVQGGQSGGDNAPASVTIPKSNIRISGNTVAIDFGGVDMTTIPAGTATIWMQGVMGANGLSADYNGNSVLTEYVTMVAGEAPSTGGDDQKGPGEVGAIELNKLYEVYTELTGTFTPTTNGTLTATYEADGNPVVTNIWDSVIFTDADCTQQVDGNYETAGVQTYVLTAGTTYYVKANVSDPDDLFGSGLFSYPFGVTFSYAEGGEVPGAGLIEAVIPADGSDIAGFLDGDKIQVKFKEEPAFFMFNLYTFEDPDGEGFAGSWGKGDFTLNEDGYYEKTFGFDYLVYEGDVATGVFTVYTDATMAKEVGSETIFWNGTTPKSGSAVVVTNIVPANNTSIDLNADGSATIELTFSAPVTCTAAVPAGYGTENPVSSVVGSEGNTVWTVTVSEKQVKEVYEGYSALKVTVYAKDADGNPVYYENFDFIALSYEINGDMQVGEDFNVSLENKEVEAPVEAFTVSASAAISANDYNNVLEVDGEWVTINAYQNITVYDAAGTEVTKVAPLATVGGGEEPEAIFNGTVTFVTPITQPGVYTIHFPYGAFTIGEETTGKYSIEKDVEFTVVEGEGPDVPEGYEPMLFDQTYDVKGVGAVKVFFTPETEGTLKVTQTGSSDTHIWNALPNTNNFEVNILPAENISATAPYVLTYVLKPGVTYYSYAKQSTYDDLTSISFTWEPIEVGEYEIELGKVYKFGSDTPVHYYTAEADGILTAEWNAYFGDIAVGDNQYFFYSNPGATDLVPALYVGNGEKGYRVEFEVTEGTTYYVRLYTVNKAGFDVVFTLDTEAKAEAIITSIEPTPGTAYDVRNFRYSWNVLLSPNAGSAESVELTYVAASTNQPQTIQVYGSEFGVDAFRVSADALVRLIENNEIAGGTDVVFTLNGLKAGSNYVTAYKGAGADYVEIGENGVVKVTFSTGKAIQPENATFPNPFYQEFEKGMEEAIGTITYDGNIGAAGEVSVIQGQVVQGGQSSGDNAPASVTIPKENVTFKGNTLYIDFSGINMSTIPAGTATIWVSGVKGENGLDADYDGFSVGTYYVTVVEGKTTGIDKVVDAQDGMYIVYDMNGMLILSTENGAELNGLANGLYIINGKKVLIRR